MKAEKYSNELSLGWGLPSFETPLHILKAISESLFSDKEINWNAVIKNGFLYIDKKKKSDVLKKSDFYKS